MAINHDIYFPHFSFFSTPATPTCTWADTLISESTASFHFQRARRSILGSNDKVEGSVLASSFDETCRAWKGRYGVRYTHCGCASPSGKGTHRALPLIGGRHLVPPHRDDVLAATHPSDHNAVFSPSESAPPLHSAGHDPAFLAPIRLEKSDSDDSELVEKALDLLDAVNDAVHDLMGFAPCAAVS